MEKKILYTNISLLLKQKISINCMKTLLLLIYRLKFVLLNKYYVKIFFKIIVQL